MAVTIIHKSKPSNKTETLPTSPFIDKISIVLKPESKQDAHDIYMGLFQSLDDPELWAHAPKGKGYNLGKRIKLPSVVYHKRWPLFQVRYDGKSQQVEMIRLEFVPVDLGPVGMIELHAVMMTLMDGGWEYMAKHGHVTRIDVTVDLPGVRMDGFQFLPKYPSTTMRWTLNGALQTVVLGKSTGNQTSVYSRKIKRLAKGQKWPGQSVVRVEKRLVNVGVKLHQLTTLPNPFANMTLTENMPAPPSGVSDLQLLEHRLRCADGNGLLRQEEEVIHSDAGEIDGDVDARHAGVLHHVGPAMGQDAHQLDTQLAHALRAEIGATGSEKQREFSLQCRYSRVVREPVAVVVTPAFRNSGWWKPF